MTVSLVTNVRAVLPTEVIDHATIAVEDGHIVAVEANRYYAGGFDGRGAFCLPGLIDTHSDAIEREVTPRPNVSLDESFALRSLESRVVAAGITTICHGIGFERLDSHARSMGLARRLVEVIGARRATDEVPVDHRVLYRVPARSEGGLDTALDLLSAGQDPGQLPLLSFEDHTPGQGQYRNIDKFKQYLDSVPIPNGEDVDAYVARRIAEGNALLPVREHNLARVSELARSGRARVLVHDCEEGPDMHLAQSWGASVAEFPLTVSAAQAAREHGMPVVMGAPNVLRGGSHSGNAAAAELVGAGLCTSLASDYLPSSLLAAAFLLFEQGVTTLSRAVGLVTSGPAEVLGLTDRGRIEVGARADLVLVSLDGRWPRVSRVVRSCVDAADVALSVASLVPAVVG
jgi:alpha-D-ribose 1-methylphosphonate 5-triphosphate diphosphatase